VSRPLAHGDAYAAALPAAKRLRIVAGAGHAAPLEQAEATAVLVAKLLQEP
jgi:pimeloyl-ACP methyl ester carboxylesterase